MKPARASKGRSSAKRPTKPKTIEEYFAALEPSARTVMNRMRAAIRSVVPKDAAETISYGIPAFKHKKILVWYAAFATHYSLFPTASVIAACKDQLQGLTVSKGTIRFPANKPLPIALIKKLVQVRVANLQ